ncbi:trichohyalin [Drosophila tropicalis]|uniref:trichohyalin n=1 Tax=Drosophila tropicalis TaxID=46794 RepID=UPI0035AB87E9
MKRKVYRKYEEFIRPRGHVEPEPPKPINLVIDDFNARGEIANPRAPCVVTTIDPDYIEDASLQRLAKKFRMKTDILLLREITRNRFMYYATQEMFLNRKREKEHQDKLYQKAEEFHKFADDALKKMEAEEFKKMLEAQQKLKALKENKVSEELSQVKLEHQRVLMEVQEVYGRFQYLLKLISYFDDTVEEEIANQEDEEKRLILPKEIVSMEISERQPAGLEQVQQVQDYMEGVVRPYLSKRHHLNAEIWIKGYERNRMKVSNYNRRFTQLALLNHIVGMLQDKAQKTYERQVRGTVFLKDPEFLQRRVAALQLRANELLDDYEQRYCKDKLSIKLASIVPVILKHIRNKVQPEQNEKKEEPVAAPVQKSSKQWRTMEDLQTPLPTTKIDSYKDEQDTTLAKVEKIQSYALELMGKLDTIAPNQLRMLEQRVRRRLAMEKEMSRRALVKQNRLHNWMEHFKKHHRLLQEQAHRHKHHRKNKK